MSEQIATILVVDDVSANRDLLAALLDRAGYQVVAAENGEIALAQLATHDVDLVLLDIMMPVMDGFEALERMKADTRLRDIPVIVISASGEIEHVVRCVGMGAEDYLTKPFNSVLLKARIGACLQKKRLHDQELEYQRQIEAERRRSDDLLHALFPDFVVSELKSEDRFAPRRYPDVAVLFADVVGFTAHCDQHDAEQVVSQLQILVQGFENLSRQYDLDKIKTSGDSYVAAAGLLNTPDNAVLNCLRCAVEMLRLTRATPPHWELRIGIHRGPIVGGVVGKQRYCFDIWGDTVNTAARVESHGQVGSVSLSDAAWQRVETMCLGASRCVEVKGKGALRIHTFGGFKPGSEIESTQGGGSG